MIKQTIKAPAFLTPAAVAAINEAYAEACRFMKASDRDDQLRFRLADQIIVLARNGELDPRRLSTQAVAAVMCETDAHRPDAAVSSAVNPGALGVGEFGKTP